MKWTEVLKNNFRHWEPLADFLELTKEQRQKILPHPSFILNLPQRLAEKIRKSSLEDPILKQFLPSKAPIKRMGIRLAPEKR